MPELIDRDEVLKALEEIAVTFDYLVWGDVEHVVKAATPRRCETCECYTLEGDDERDCSHPATPVVLFPPPDFGCTLYEKATP